MTVRVPLCLSLALAAALAGGGDWPRFRGENGAGVADVPGLPASWSPADVSWSTALPGIGHSSPVVLGRRLFVTSATEDGTARHLHGLDAVTGKLEWTRALSLKADTLHLKNSYASSTPAIDEKHVYVTFADDERHVVAAFTHDGTQVWTKDLGPYESQHGHGASPIVYGKLVIVPNDQDGPSSIVALDAVTGETAWTAARNAGRTSYSTPFVLEAKGREPQLIASSDTMGVTSLDPATGKLNWKSGPLPQRTVGSPVFAGGLIFQACGQGGRGVLMVAVDPFAEGEKRVAGDLTKLLPYVPTPVVHDGRLFLWNDNGVVVCLDPKTRETVWTERIGGNYSASPVCVGGRLYNVSEDGEVVVLAAGPKYELLGRTPLGGRSHASPAVAGGRLYFRTFDKVICVAPRTAT